MNDEKTFRGRRAELMAELFLQELNPAFVAKTDNIDFGVDFILGFKNDSGGINVVFVEVKSTESTLRQDVKVSRNQFKILSNSNVPGLVLVVDVKTNSYYYRLVDKLISIEGKSSIVLSLKEYKQEERDILINEITSRCSQSVT